MSPRRPRLSLLLASPIVLALGALGPLGACGGSTSAGSPISLSGTVAGTTFHVASEVAVLGSNPPCAAASGCTPASNGEDYVSLFLTNRAESVFTCAGARSSADDNFANLDTLEIGVIAASGKLAPGTYDVVSDALRGPGLGAGAEFETSDSTCQTSLDALATAGNVTLTRVSASRVAGTYSLTFATQGTFTGSFDQPICDLAEEAGSSSSVDASAFDLCQP